MHFFWTNVESFYLPSFLSLSLLFPEMGRLGLMWLCGDKGKACQSPLDPQWMVWSPPIWCVISPHGSLGHLADTHCDPDHLPLVCLPILQPVCASSGPCWFSGLPRHQHIHSLRHKWPSIIPRGQSSATFIWPLVQATTTPLPHVLTKSLPIWPLPPRVPALIKLNSSLNFLITTFWTHELKIYFSNPPSFPSPVVHRHGRVNNPFLFNTCKGLLYICPLFISFLRWYL